MRKNTPVTVSYTKLGQKVYSGDLIPIALNRQQRRMFSKNPNKNTNNAKINKCRRQYIELRPIARIFVTAKEKIKDLLLSKSERIVTGYRKPTLINHYQTKRFGK